MQRRSNLIPLSILVQNSKKKKKVFIKNCEMIIDQGKNYTR